MHWEEKLLFVEYLKGQLVQVRDTVVVIEANGVGYSLTVPDSTKRTLPALGEHVQLFCWTPAREPTPLGFLGFRTEEERRLFCHLNSDPESSPSLSLAILGVLSEEQRDKCLAAANCLPAGKTIFGQTIDDALAAISSIIGSVLPQSYIQRRYAVRSFRRLGLASEDADKIVQAASIRWRDSCEKKNHSADRAQPRHNPS